MFYSKINFKLKSKNDVYSYIVIINILIIQIRNIINKTYIVSRYVKLNRVFDYEKRNYYIITQKNIYLIIKLKKQIFKNLFKLVLTKLVNVLMLIDELILNLSTANNNVIFNTSVIITKFVIIEIIISREIIIYNNEKTSYQLKKIIDQFFTLWINHNQFIDISKKMFINLTFDVKMQISKFYSLNKQN